MAAVQYQKEKKQLTLIKFNNKINDLRFLNNKTLKCNALLDTLRLKHNITGFLVYIHTYKNERDQFFDKLNMFYNLR